MDRVNDLVEFRIDAVLQEMSGSALCILPEDEPITCAEFVQTTRVKTAVITTSDFAILYCDFGLVVIYWSSH